MNEGAARRNDEGGQHSDLIDCNDDLDGHRADDDQHNLPSKVQEMSPNERYVRFAEVLSHTEDIKVSYRGFDTRNGIEVAWHAIDLSGLNDAEQEEVARSANSLKELDSQYIAQYLSVWVNDEPRRLIIITALLESLREFIGKVRILRWRIVKKWCRQILRGLSYLHTHNPRIVHRNLSCDYVYINGGEGQLKIGNTWLSAILGDDSDPVSFSETMTRHSRIIGSPAYNGPEIFEKRALDTKADIYSLGICLVEIITRSEAYSECKGVYSKIARLKMMGVPPLCLLRVTHPLALQFIELCLRSDPSERPTADELKRHPFLDKAGDFDDDEVTLEPLPELPASGDSLENLADLHRNAISLRVHTDAWTPDVRSTEMVEFANVTTPSVLEVATPGAGLLACCVSDQLSPSEPAVGTNGSDDGKGEQNSVPITVSKADISTDNSALGLAVGGKSTPRNNSSKNKFGKEFAALYKGEDVREDRGVQDGRRPTEEDIEEDDNAGASIATTAPSIVAPKQASPPAAVNKGATAHRVVNPTSVSSGYDISSPVKVSLKIGREHTADGEGREVEFIFNPNNDDFEVVAQEMIEELALTLPVHSLADSIAIEVLQTQQSVIRAYSAMEEERRSHGVSEPADFIALSSDSLPAAAPTSHLDVAESPVPQCGQADCRNAPDTTHLRSADKIAPLVDSSAGVDVTDNSVLASSSEQPQTAAEPAAKEALVVISAVDTTGTEASVSVESPRQQDTAPTEDSDSDDDMFELDDEDRHLREEIMRIDKEAGHARRVFEQRIQKHKSIQASLDEDIENRKLEYAQKLESIDRKLEFSRKKTEDEVNRIKEEFQEKVSILREEIKQRIIESRRLEKLSGRASSSQYY